MQFDVSTTDLTFVTAALVLLILLIGVVSRIYRFIRDLDEKLGRLDAEFANGHDVDADDYVGFRVYVEHEFGHVRERLADGRQWMRDHEQRRPDDAHGRVQPPR